MVFQFSIQNGPGPTHPLPNVPWMFGIFLTLQHPLQHPGCQLTLRHKSEHARLSGTVFPSIPYENKPMLSLNLLA